MTRIKLFLKNAIVGGLLVILPVAIFLFILSWFFGLIRRAISPLTIIVMEKSPVQGLVADILVIAILIVICFAVGVIVRTKAGKWMHSILESKIFLKAPGYMLIKETIFQFIGKSKPPFSSVALVQLFDNEVLATGFITDEHEDGIITVFIPTGPNPTSGLIYHLPQRLVHPVKVTIEEAMRSIISCGAGSSPIISKRKNV
jgi:uncharacterized membrane protein